MSATGIVLHVDGFALSREADDSELRIRDVDLAEKLGYSEPRLIRRLIKSMIDSGDLPGVCMRAVRARIEIGPKNARRTREETVNEYWLDHVEALIVVMRCDQPNAVPMRRVIAEVFRKALVQQQEARDSLRGLPAHLERWFLSTTASAFELLWQDSLVREIERLHGREWKGGRHPYHMQSTYPQIYRMIMTSEIAERMFANNPDRDRIRYHQLLTVDARKFMVNELGKVEAIARQSGSKADFWSRMAREYAGGFLQLRLGGDAE